MSTFNKPCCPAAETPMTPISEAAPQPDDPDIETKRQESMKMAWGGQVPQTLDQPQAPAAAPDMSSLSSDELEAELRRRPSVPDLASMSSDELEAELRRRREAEA